MKYFINLVLLIGGLLPLNAQQTPFTMPPIQSWTTLNNATNMATFRLPTPPIIKDTLQTAVYASPIDTALALQVVIHENNQLNTADTIFNQALLQNNGDTLRAMATLSLAVTNSTLLSLNEIVQPNGKKGLEYGMAYQSLGSSYPLYTIMRIYLANGKFYAFAVTGMLGDETRLITYKDAFFNSINIQ